MLSEEHACMHVSFTAWSQSLTHTGGEWTEKLWYHIRDNSIHHSPWYTACSMMVICTDGGMNCAGGGGIGCLLYGELLSGSVWDHLSSDLGGDCS